MQEYKKNIKIKHGVTHVFIILCWFVIINALCVFFVCYWGKNNVAESLILMGPGICAAIGLLMGGLLMFAGNESCFPSIYRLGLIISSVMIAILTFITLIFLSAIVGIHYGNTSLMSFIGWVSVPSALFIYFTYFIFYWNKCAAVTRGK